MSGVDCLGLFGFPSELPFGVGAETDFRLLAEGGECGVTKGPGSNWKPRLNCGVRD